MSEVLRALDAVIAERKRAADPGASYVSALMHKGLDAILKKVAEESGETLLAAKDAANGGDPAAVVRETADLWFHSLVMLGALGLDSSAVLAELERRFGLSGLEEKAARGAAAPATHVAD